MFSTSKHGQEIQRWKWVAQEPWSDTFLGTEKKNIWQNNSYNFPKSINADIKEAAQWAPNRTNTKQAWWPELDPRAHVVGEDNSHKLSSDLHLCARNRCTHTHIHTHCRNVYAPKEQSLLQWLMSAHWLVTDSCLPSVSQHLSDRQGRIISWKKRQIRNEIKKKKDQKQTNKTKK